MKFDNLPHYISIKQAKKILASRHGAICSKKHGHGCGKKFALAELTLDHIIPKALGGPSSDSSNMQLLCIACHKKKTTQVDRKLIFDMEQSIDAPRSRVQKLITRALREAGR